MIDRLASISRELSSASRHLTLKKNSIEQGFSHGRSDLFEDWKVILNSDLLVKKGNIVACTYQPTLLDLNVYCKKTIQGASSKRCVIIAGIEWFQCIAPSYTRTPGWCCRSSRARECCADSAEPSSPRMEELYLNKSTDATFPRLFRRFLSVKSSHHNDTPTDCRPSQSILLR